MTTATSQPNEHDDRPLEHDTGTTHAVDPNAPSRAALRTSLRTRRPHPTWTGARTSTVPLGDCEGIGDDDDPLDDAEPDAASPAAVVPGHHIMERTDIKAALKASGYDGSYDAMSGGEETRARTLVALQRSDLWRPHVIGTPAMVARLDHLARQQANFAAVIDLIRDAAHLSMVAGTAVQIPPILVVGSPGVGKSRFARGLAQCLETDLNTINGSTIPDVGSISGYPPVWRSAAQGRLSKFLLAARSTAPIIFIDECEKISDFEEMQCPLDRLLTVLEPTTASAFQDENLQVPMRADCAIFLFAANSLTGLSGPFLDRVVTIRVPDLHRDQRDEVLEAMLAEVTAPVGFHVSLASRAALQPLHALGLRRARLALGIAVARAVALGRRFVTRADLNAAVAVLERPDEARRPMGFIHPRGREGDA